MTHPTPGGFRGLLYVLRSFLPSFVRVTAVLAAKRAEPHDRARPTAPDRARPTAPDHARPNTHDHEWPTTHDAHDCARPRTTAHDRARPRTTTHDHAWQTAHDRARPRTTTHDHAWLTTHDWPRTTDRARPTTAAIFVWGSGTHPTPGGFRGLNCVARLVLARERTPSLYINLRRSRDCLRGGVPSFVTAVHASGVPSSRPDSFSSLWAKEEHASWINMIPLKISHLFGFSVSNQLSQCNSLACLRLDSRCSVSLFDSTELCNHFICDTSWLFCSHGNSFPFVHVR